MTVAARVQEIADLSVNDFRAEKPSTLRLTGKGSKTRIVPLMSTTSDLVSKYISIYHPSYRGEYNVPLFSNRKKEKLTRAGIAYILKKYVKIAREKQPDLIPEIVSPHGLRHSKSMHMLQAGVPLIYIRDFLGHSKFQLLKYMPAVIVNRNARRLKTHVQASQNLKRRCGKKILHC